MQEPRLGWKSRIDATHPIWKNHAALLLSLDDSSFPDAAALNRLLPTGLVNDRGRPVRFVPASALPDVAYEKHIHEQGEVSTREDNWHDLFNALAWSRWPLIKVSMNRVHYRELNLSSAGQRGPVRDALTLFDESGVIVTSPDATILKHLAQRNWHGVFMDCRDRWRQDLGIFVTGHALFEKFLLPFKSITAHVLLIQCEIGFNAQADDHRLRSLDADLADAMDNGTVLISTQQLSPLPLMGIPGWWRDGCQDADFYADENVFRRPPTGFHPAPVIKLGR